MQLNRRTWLQTLGTASTLAASSGVFLSSVTAQQAGTEQWVFETGENVAAAPTVVDGTVYVGSDKVYALDATAGTEQWAYETDKPVASAANVIAGTVYVGSYDGKVYALDAADGTEQWAYETGNPVVSSPTVVDGTVYVGSTAGTVHALDTAAGTERWTYQTGNGVWASPTVVDGTVYIGSIDGIVYALDAADGTVQWTFDTNRSVWGSPTVADGVVYIGDTKTAVHALDAADGTKRWDYRTDGGVLSTPTVANGTVYVGCFDNTVYALDATAGTERWTYETGERVWSSPTVAAGTVYVGSDDDHVYALDAADGTQQWSYATGDVVHSSPTVVDGTVYIGSWDNNVYALAADGASSSEGTRVDLGTLGHDNTWASPASPPENPSQPPTNTPPTSQTPLDVTPQPLDFGTTAGDHSRGETLTLSNPTDEPIRVEAFETPPEVSVESNCTFNMWILRYSCDPTPPLTIDADSDVELSLSVSLPVAGAVTSIDASATLQTDAGPVSIPVTATTLASRSTLESYEAAANEFAQYLNTTAGAEALGDELMNMYENAFKAVGHRIGKQYKDALKDVDSMGSNLVQAGETIEAKQFVQRWEASFKSPEAEPQPNELQGKLLDLQASLSNCRSHMESGEYNAAVEDARAAEAQAKTVATEVETAYENMDNQQARNQFDSFVTSVRAYANAVTGGGTFTVTVPTE